MSVQNLMHAIFFPTQGPPIQIAVPEGRGVTDKFYRDKVLKYLKRYNSKRRPKSGIKNISLLHDNAPSHKAGIVAGFLQQENVTVLSDSPYSPELTPYDYFCFLDLSSCLLEENFALLL